MQWVVDGWMEEGNNIYPNRERIGIGNPTDTLNETALSELNVDGWT